MNIYIEIIVKWFFKVSLIRTYNNFELKGLPLLNKGGKRW